MAPRRTDRRAACVAVSVYILMCIGVIALCVEMYVLMQNHADKHHEKWLKEWQSRQNEQKQSSLSPDDDTLIKNLTNITTAASMQRDKRELKIEASAKVLDPNETQVGYTMPQELPPQPTLTSQFDPNGRAAFIHLITEGIKSSGDAASRFAEREDKLPGSVRGKNLYYGYDCGKPSVIQDVAYDREGVCHVRGQNATVSQSRYAMLVRTKHAEVAGYRCAMARTDLSYFCGS